MQADETIISEELDPPENAVTLAVGKMTIYLPLADMVDLVAERARIESEMSKVDDQIRRSEKLLKTPGFVNKAPEKVVDRERTKLESLKDRRVQLEEHLQEF